MDAWSPGPVFCDEIVCCCCTQLEIFFSVSHRISHNFVTATSSSQQQLDWIKTCIDQYMMGFELCLQQKLSCWPKFWIVVQQPALMINCGGREEEKEEEEEKAVVTCEILPWMIMIHIKHSTALHFWVTKSKRQNSSPCNFYTCCCYLEFAAMMIMF
jgi:hypothetical protein